VPDGTGRSFDTGLEYGTVAITPTEKMRTRRGGGSALAFSAVGGLPNRGVTACALRGARILRDGPRLDEAALLAKAVGRLVLPKDCVPGTLPCANIGSVLPAPVI
jgi:hypothetical protein